MNDPLFFKFPGWTLRCYTCGGPTTDCNENVARDIECSSEMNQCYKVIDRTSGSEKIEKGCANDDSCKIREQQSSGEDYKPFCCQEDLCNAGQSDRLSVSLSLLFVVFVVQYFMAH